MNSKYSKSHLLGIKKKKKNMLTNFHFKIHNIQYIMVLTTFNQQKNNYEKEKKEYSLCPPSNLQPPPHKQVNFNPYHDHMTLW